MAQHLKSLSLFSPSQKRSTHYPFAPLLGLVCDLAAVQRINNNQVGNRVAHVRTHIQTHAGTREIPEVER